MDTKKFVGVLNHLVSVGVERVFFNPSTETNETHISGAGMMGNVIVFDTVDGLYGSGRMLIQNTNALLARMMLFDAEKASVNFSKDAVGVRDVEIKQGRRTTSFRCAAPVEGKLGVPGLMPDMNLDGDPVVFTQEFVGELSKAISAIGMTGDKKKQKIIMSVEDGNFTITVFDGEDDSYRETAALEGVQDFREASFNIGAFHRVIKHISSTSDDKKVSFWVSEQGIAVFDAKPVAIMLAPEIN